jgi:hypothetical protein
VYVVLSGAKKNAGDFLITSRATALLGRLRPDRSLVELPAWEPLEPHLEQVNAARAVIILGGPGYQPAMYPGVYKLTTPLSRIEPPVIPLALGWKGFPGDEQTVRTYGFTPESVAALRWMSERAEALGTRDHQTVRVLRAAGIPNVAMNGCAAWYDLDSLGKGPTLPDELRTIVYTPAQRDLYADQSIALGVALRDAFPRARLVAAFHRGLGDVDAFTPSDDATNTARIAARLREAGLEIADLAGGVDGFRLYDDCDLHVGYRVHAHIYRSSKRRPSILIHEDGRGVGVTDALGTLGVDAFRRARSRRAANPVMRRLRRRPDKPAGVVARSDAPQEVIRLIHQEVETGFARCAGVGEVIDRYFTGMERFVRALP